MLITFRQPNNTVCPEPKEDVCSDEVVIGSDTLPVIDFQCINEEQLHEACAEWGVLFRLVNHGIPTSLMNQLNDPSKQVFNYSFETKQRLFRRVL